MLTDHHDQWQSGIPGYTYTQSNLYSSSAKNISSAPKESISSPPSRASDEEHVYSFPNKQKSAEPSPTMMSSSLGSNLSELDRLLLELNAVQQCPSSSSIPDDICRSPPQSAAGTVSHYSLADGVHSIGVKNSMAKEKPKRNGGRGIEDVRPSVESLLDELESSVPSPVPAIVVSQGEVSSPQRISANQQQTRISASSATRELDELMASLSDFKTCSTLSLVSEPPSPGLQRDSPYSEHSKSCNGHAPAHTPLGPPPASPYRDSPPPLSLGSLPVLRIEEDGSSSTVLRSPTTFQHPSMTHSSTMKTNPGISPTTSVSPFSFRSCENLVQNGDVPLSIQMESQGTYPDGPVRHLQFNGDGKFGNHLLGKHRPAISATTVLGGLSPMQTEGPASERLLAMPTYTGSSVHPNSENGITEAVFQQPLAPQPDEQKKEDQISVEVNEPLLVPVERQAAFPDTNSVKDPEQRPPEVQSGWALEPEGHSDTEAMLSVGNYWRDPGHTRGGCSGAYGDLDQHRSSTASPDSADSVGKEELEALPVSELQPVERISASRQMKTLIGRTKEIPNVHPMTRDLSPRRKLGPAIFHKTVSQDRLIEELHGKLGIGKQEHWKSQEDDWLTEGVIITSRPPKKQRDGEQQIEKIIIPPESPLPQRRTIAVQPSPPMKRRVEVFGFGSTKEQLLSLPNPPPPPPPPPPLPCHPSALFPPPNLPSSFSTRPPHPRFQWETSPDDYQEHAFLAASPLEQPRFLNRSTATVSSSGQTPPVRAPPASKLQVSIGCQTEEDPFFPPLQMIWTPPMVRRTGPYTARPPLGPPAIEKPVAGPRAPLSYAPFQDEHLLYSSSDQSLPLHQTSPSYGRHQTHFMAQGKAGSSSPPSAPPKPGSQLDNMLGSLQSDLNKLGVATVAKGVCGACKKPIAGQVVTAMGRTWHPEHFVCTHCQEEIGSRNFFERDGQPYCEKDYHNLFSPRCYYCNGPILDKVVTALDTTWHPEHFFCAQCGAFFGPEGFHERDGKAYCRKDYFDMFAPKCGGCARAILENYISALNSLWHPECFVCRECFTPFINGSFFEHDGQPYCEVHYHERRGSLCSGCQKPITGRCITAMGKKFHPEHFVCAYCLKQLNKGTFKEQNEKPYCQYCFPKLFS
ncbi:paxillin isoform X2 [Ambystoma mexicanum]